jgi:hypothetical protein
MKNPKSLQDRITDATGIAVLAAMGLFLILLPVAAAIFDQPSKSPGGPCMRASPVTAEMSVASGTDC